MNKEVNSLEELFNQEMQSLRYFSNDFSNQILLDSFFQALILKLTGYLEHKFQKIFEEKLKKDDDFFKKIFSNHFQVSHHTITDIKWKTISQFLEQPVEVCSYKLPPSIFEIPILKLFCTESMNQYKDLYLPCLSFPQNINNLKEINAFLMSFSGDEIPQNSADTDTFNAFIQKYYGNTAKEEIKNLVKNHYKLEMVKDVAHKVYEKIKKKYSHTVDKVILPYIFVDRKNDNGSISDFKLSHWTDWIVGARNMIAHGDRGLKANVLGTIQGISVFWIFYILILIDKNTISENGG